MRIAIDFDDTITKDPDLWNDFIASALSRGHDVVVVTMRDTAHSARVFATVDLPRHKIYFTALHAKRDFMESRGVGVDVWIDDKPEFVCRDHDALSDPSKRWADEAKFNTGVCPDTK